MQTNTYQINPPIGRNENKLNPGEWLLVIYMFAISTNLINQFFLLATGIFVIAALYYALDVKLSKSLAVLLVYAVADMVGCMIGGSVLLATLMRPFYYILFFVLGKTISKDGNRKISLYMILAMAFGAASHGIANFIMNYMEYGMNPHFRNLPDIWTGEALAATGQGALFAPFAGILFYGIFCTKKLFSKLIFIAVLVCLCLYNMMTASRTVFVILGISLIVCFAIYMLQKGGDARMFIWFLGIIIVAAVIYMANLFDVREFIEDTALTKRIDTMDTSFFYSSRTDKMWHYITHMYQSPFGGRFIKADYYSFAHNLFLDLYDEAGFLGLFFILWFCVIILKKSWKFVNFEWIDIPFKILVVGIMLSIFLQMMVEPVLEGMPWMFAMFCTVSGIVEGLCEYGEKSNNRIE